MSFRTRRRYGLIAAWLVVVLGAQVVLVYVASLFPRSGLFWGSPNPRYMFISPKVPVPAGQAWMVVLAHEGRLATFHVLTMTNYDNLGPTDSARTRDDFQRANVTWSEASRITNPSVSRDVDLVEVALGWPSRWIVFRSIGSRGPTNAHAPFDGPGWQVPIPLGGRALGQALWGSPSQASIWFPGLVWNTFVGMLPLVLVPIAFGLRARRRRRCGLCARCGYSLAGLVSGAACPECGEVLGCS